MIDASKKLFYPEGERIIRRPIDEWEQDLKEQFSLLCSKQKEGEKNDQLLVIINQASLIAVYLGQNKLAYQICYGAIEYFMHAQKRERLVENVFQPWINIGRLNIVEKKFQQAHHVFNDISPFSAKNSVHRYEVDRSALRKDILNLTRNCFFYEKLKIYLHDYKNIEDLFAFCDEHQQRFKQHYALFLEARILAFILIKEHGKAFETLLMATQHIHENYRPIFILRSIDLGLFFQESIENINLLILNLFHQHLDYIPVLNLQGLYFCLEICKRLKVLEKNFYLLQMLTALIKRFQDIHEEVGLVESFHLGKELSQEYHEKFTSLMAKTKYSFLKKRFLGQDVRNSFPLGEELISFLNKET